MKSLQNINNAFSLVRNSIIVVVICNILIIGFCYIYSHFFNAKQYDRIYSLSGEIPVMIALGQNVKDNRQAEAKAHLKYFHKLFFSIVPDKDEIKYNMQEAMLLGDESIASLYSSLDNGGYFRQICSANIRCSYICDSIILDLANYPYYAKCYGRTSIVRTSGTTVRNLVTSCYLRNVLRSDEIPHGFLIEDFKVLENSDLDDANSIF